MEKKESRRIVLTKVLLKDALIQLMKQQHISKVSVKAICDLADVNRSTFYAHYADQYDLLHQVERELLDNLRSSLNVQVFNDQKPLSTQVLAQLLESVKENADLCKALLSENCEASFQKEIIVMAQILAGQIQKNRDKRLQEYLDTFSVMGCISIVQKWLQDDMKESPQQMSEIIIQALYHGIMSF